MVKSDEILSCTGCVAAFNGNGGLAFACSFCVRNKNLLPIINRYKDREIVRKEMQEEQQKAALQRKEELKAADKQYQEYLKTLPRGVLKVSYADGHEDFITVRDKTFKDVKRHAKKMLLDICAMHTGLFDNVTEATLTLRNESKEVFNLL